MNEFRRMFRPPTEGSRPLSSARAEAREALFRGDLPRLKSVEPQEIIVAKDPLDVKIAQAVVPYEAFFSDLALRIQAGEGYGTGPLSRKSREFNGISTSGAGYLAAPFTMKFHRVNQIVEGMNDAQYVPDSYQQEVSINGKSFGERVSLAFDNGTLSTIQYYGLNVNCGAWATSNCPDDAYKQSQLREGNLFEGWGDWRTFMGLRLDLGSEGSAPAVEVKWGNDLIEQSQVTGKKFVALTERMQAPDYLRTLNDEDFTTVKTFSYRNGLFIDSKREGPDVSSDRFTQTVKRILSYIPAQAEK